MGAALAVAQAAVLATVIEAVFLEGWGVERCVPLLLALAGVFAGRAALGWAQEWISRRSSAAVKSVLRLALLRRAAATDEVRTDPIRSGEVAMLATRGLDSLDVYFAQYLPTMILCGIVPVVVVICLATVDPLAALIVALTVPIVPFFMALIGMATERHKQRRWEALARLARHFLDVVQGLPTLRVFGRGKAQLAILDRVTDDYRRESMATLRVAFLSAFALELAATLSVALVAVTIGLRLVDATLDLRTGLFALILAPEAYLPLRKLGASYHAAEEGLGAADRAFQIIEPAERGAAARAAEAATTGEKPDPVAPAAGLRIRVEGVGVRHPGRRLLAPCDASFDLSSGEIVALVGPSGVGKTTLLEVVLGLRGPGLGAVQVDGDGRDRNLALLDRDEWHARVSFVPQRPYLFPGTVADNVRLAAPQATDAEVAAALAGVGLEDLDPQGQLGESGAGISSGQRRRIGVARALLRKSELLVLDEPTAGLDAATEHVVLAAIKRAAREEGRAVLMAAHRAAALEVADRIVSVAAADDATFDGSAAAAVAAAAPTTEVAAAAGPAAAPAPVPSSEPGYPAATALGAGSGRGFGPLVRFARLAGPFRWRLALAVLAGVAAAGASIGLTATSAWLISRAAEHPPVLTLMVAVTSVRFFGVSRGVFRYLERLTAHDAAFRVLGRLRVTIYRRLERLAPAGLAEFRSGDLLSRLVDDVDGLADVWLRLLLPYFTAFVTISACVAGLWLLVPGAGLALGLSVALVAFGVPALTVGLSRRADARLATIRGELSGASLELLAGSQELVVAGAMEPRLTDLASIDARLRHSEARLSLGSGAGAFLSGLAGGAAVWLSLVAGIAAVRDGTLGGVALAVVALTPIAIHETISGLVPAAQHLPGLAAMARRVSEVASRPDPVADPANPIPLPPAPYGLRTRGLRASYDSGLPDALAMPDVDLGAGRKLLVTGESGSGKSTFAAVLVRFLDPSAGSVELVAGGGSVDLRALDGADVRRAVCLCEQEPHIFDSSILENVRLARPEATEAEVAAALSAAQLMPWIESLPDGLDTFVGERGAFISGGQRQRLSLARALLADAPLIVFDEPTEHLDEAMGRRLMEDLLGVTAGRTLVVITHRPESMAAAKWDLRIDLGRGAEALARPA